MPERAPDPESDLTLTAKDTLERANAELRAEVERLTARLEGARSGAPAAQREGMAGYCVAHGTGCAGHEPPVVNERDRMAGVLMDAWVNWLNEPSGPWNVVMANAVLAAASERERALRACLTDLQWSGGQDRHGCGICPDCYQTSSDGHTSRCALLALLAPGTESPCPGCRAGLAICPHHRPAHHVSQHNQSCQRCVAPAADRGASRA